jgi:dihydroorotate dehydrogenase electron transfer subunit
MTVATPSFTHATARVSRHADGGAGHRWLDLDLPAAFATPEPGQFVQLLLPPVASAAFLPRPMSVASAKALPSGAKRLGFLYAPVGTGTLALAAMRGGETVDVLGPLGHGFPLEIPGTPVLVAGGRGVAPLLFAADRLARAGRRSEFLFGARTRDHLVGLADVKKRIEKIGGRLHLATDDGSRGARGHVAALLERLSPRFANPLVIHACGPHAMLRAVARFGLRAGHRAFLAMESVMACGTGVCRGCPLPRSASGRTRFGNRAPSLLGNRDYAMCCTEGPVFDAGELDWERIE